MSWLLVSVAVFTAGTPSARQDQPRMDPAPVQAPDDPCGVHFRSGEYQQALECYGQALRLKRAAGDRDGEAATLTAIGVVYVTLGERQRALEYYQQALTIARAAGDRRSEAAALARIGWIYAVSGQSPQALESCNQALALYQAAGDRYGEAFALIQIGEVYARSGEHQQALEYFQQGLALRRSLGSGVLEAITLNRIGTEYQSWGQPQQALEHFAQAQRVWGTRRDPRFEIPMLFSMARAERDLDHLGEARLRMEAALDMSESVSAKATSHDLRASYRATVQGYYQFYIELLMQMHEHDPSAGHNAAALQASERARARGLLDILAEAHADIRQGVDPQLLEREHTLQKQLNAKEQNRMQLLSGKPTEEQVTAIEKELNALLTEYQDVQAQIRTRGPRYAALTQPQPLNLTEIQQQLMDADTLLLELALGRERSFLWAVTQSSIESYELPARAQIEAAARRLYELLTATHLREVQGQAQRAAAKLSQMVLGPVAGRLGRKRLLIVADGALQYIPFGALPKPVASGQRSVDSREKGSNGSLSTDYRPLILDHEIISLPSASALVVLRRDRAGRNPAGKTVAVLADPVFDQNDARVKRPESAQSAIATAKNQRPATGDQLVRSVRESGIRDLDRLLFSRQEAEVIMELAPEGKKFKALDFNASRATAMSKELGEYRIVHIATHGLLNSQHPELSGIVLSLVDQAGQPQDGFLRLHEIYNLDLKADLVVLSACQTALGKEIRGEGLVSLTRGFMYAGAPRVVASLWDVTDEATLKLMKRFYQGMLRDGLRPAAALRAAQVAMWREKRWGAPYYWAGFVLQGEWK